MRHGARRLQIIAMLGLLLASAGAQAAMTFVYEGTLQKSDGEAVTGGGQVKIQIRSPNSDDCLLFEETHTVPANDQGYFSIEIGKDASAHTGGPAGYKLDDVLSNRKKLVGLTCANGTEYQPSESATSSSDRKLVVMVKPAGESSFTSFPSQTLAASPYAMQAKNVGGFSPEHLLRLDDTAAANNTTPFTNAMLTELKALLAGTSAQYQQSGKFMGQNVSASTFGSGEALRYDGTNWVTYSPLASSDVAAFAKTNLPTCGANQVLVSDGTSLSCVNDATGGSPSDATTSSKGVVAINSSGGIAVSSGTISLASSGVAAGTYQKVTVDTTGRVTVGTTLAAADIPSLDAAKITTGTLAMPLTTSGNVSANSVSSKSIYVWDSDNSNSIEIVTPATGALTGNYVLTLPTTDGSAGEILQTDGSGQLSWTTASAGSVTNVGLTLPNIFSVSGGPVTSSGTFAATLASQTQNTVWAAPNGAGGTPTFRALVSDDIPTLDAAKVGTGTFAAAQIPLLDAAKITSGTFATTQIPSMDAAKITSGTFALARIPALDASNVATGTFAASQIPALDASKVGTGTFASAQIPSLDAGKITTGTITTTVNNTTFVGTRSVQVADSDSTNKVTIQTPATGTLTSDYVLTLPADDGANGQILTTDGNGVLSWVAAGGSGTVTNVGLALPPIFNVTGGPVTSNGTFTATLASQTQNTVWAAPDASSGSPTFRALVAADVPGLDAGKITTGTFGAAQIPALDAAKINTGTFTAAQIPVLDAGKITTGTFATAQIPFLDAGKVNTGTFAPTQIPGLDAAKITSGTFTTSQIPALDANKITTGTITNGVNNTTVVGTRSVQVFDSDSTNKVTIVTPVTGSLTSDYTLTLPVDDGTNGQILRTDGNGVLSWVAAGGTGSVTNVGLTLPNIFIVTGGPVTTNGTFDATLATQAANSFWAAPNGAPGAPTFRSMVAADVPALDAAKITTGTFAATQIPDLDSAKIATGTLGVARIPDLDAAKTVTGTFAVARIPALDASNVPTGTFAASQIPAHDATKVTTGTLTVPVSTTGMVGTRLLQVFDSDSTNKVTIVTPATASLTTDYVLTLPVDDGVASQVLTTNGSGALTWTTPASATTGTFRADNGSAAIPTFSFTGDTDSGMYNVAADTLGFATNGANRVTIGATGKVGIGTSNPGSDLDINGTSPEMNLRGTAGANLNLSTSNGSGAGPIFQLVHSGVSAVPAANGTLGEFNFVASDGTVDTQAASIMAKLVGAPMISNPSTALHFSTTDASTYGIRMTIDPSGNVGVGTTSPSAKLDVNGGVRVGDMTTCTSATNAGTIRFNGGNLQICAAAGNTWNTLSTAGGDNLGNGIAATNVQLGTFWLSGDGGNEGVFVDSSGRVGVGTSSPNNQLEVYKTQNGETAFVVSNDNTGTGAHATMSANTGTNRAIELGVGGLNYGTPSSAAWLETGSAVTSLEIRTNSGASAPIKIATAGAERMRIDNAGNVGIGLTGPAAKLHVYSTVTGAAAAMYRSGSHELVANPAGASSGTYVGLQGYANLNTNVNASAASVEGARVGADHLASGTLGTLKGISAIANNIASGTVTNAYGGYFQIGKSAGGTTTNAYGLYVDNIDATNKYAIYSADSSAVSYFAGGVGVGVTSPKTALDVSGAVRIANDTATCSSTIAGAIRFNGTSIQYCVGATWTTLASGGGSGDVVRGGNTQGSGTMVVGTNDAYPLAFETNGVTRVSIGTTGNVGIGVSNPSVLLDVYGFNDNEVAFGLTNNHTGGSALASVNVMNHAGQVGLRVGSSSHTSPEVKNRGAVVAEDALSGLSLVAGETNTATGDIRFYIATTERMRMLPSGALGIGTTNPLTLLDVKGAITANVQGTGTGQTGEVRFQELAAGGPSYAAIRAPDALSANYVLTLPGDDGTPNQVLQTDGNGLLTWVSPLVSGGTFLAGDGSVSTPGFAFSNQTNTGIFRPAASQMAVAVNGVEQIRFAAGGSEPRVGIGVTNIASSNYILNMRSTNDAKVELLSNGGDAGFDILTHNSNVNGPQINLIGMKGLMGAVAAAGTTHNLGLIQFWGSSGVGATGKVQGAAIYAKPSENWTTNNGAHLIFSTVATGSGSLAERMRIDGNGSIGIGTTTPTVGTKLDVNGTVRAQDFISTSDARLKTDIVKVGGLESILRLNGVRFRWLSDGRPEVGLIAQNIEEVFPELVFTDPVTGMKAVKYGNLVSPLIEATKGLHAMCSANEAEIKIVKEENSRLKGELEETKIELNALKLRMERIEKLLETK